MELHILHVDLDAFYASVEEQAAPELRGRPVIVGGLGPRGVVAAANYEARRFGVHSATPMARARRLCPAGVFLAPRFPAYQAASRHVMEILESYTPLVEPLSLDEAFLDVRSVRRLHGDASSIGHAIRARVLAETGLAASVGVASTKLLAKLASEDAKPDGLLEIAPDGERSYLHALPVERLWGVGASTRRRLDGLGVRTIGDLAEVPEARLVRACGAASGARLHALANNHDDRPVITGRDVKSIGHEETFPFDLRDRDAMELAVVRLAERVALRLRRSGSLTRTVVLKVRDSDFRTVTRSRTLSEPTDLGADLVGTALALLADLEINRGIRLLGVTAQHLDVGFAVQEALAFAGEAEAETISSSSRTSRRALEQAMDRARERFGDDAMIPARLANPSQVPPETSPGSGSTSGSKAGPRSGTRSAPGPAR